RPDLRRAANAVPRDRVGDLVAGPPVGQGLIQHRLQGLDHAGDLALHPGRIEGLVGVQGADFTGHVDDAAPVAHIAGTVDEHPRSATVTPSRSRPRARRTHSGMPRNTPSAVTGLGSPDAAL